MKTKKKTFTRSSGNVFEDLGLPDAVELQNKAELVRAISGAAKALGLRTQTQIAERLGIDQPRVSGLLRGRLSEFSLDALVEYLACMNMDSIRCASWVCTS